MDDVTKEEIIKEAIRNAKKEGAGSKKKAADAKSGDDVKKESGVKNFNNG